MSEDSPERFAWLLTPPELRGREAPSPPNHEELSAACRWALAQWQVLPALAPALVGWAGPERADHPDLRAVDDRVVGLKIIADVQMQLCRRLVQALDRDRIPFCLFKGSSLRLTSYDQPWQRCGKDLDVAVPRRWIRRAEELVRGLGFLPSQWNPETRRFSPANPDLRRQVEAKHYELGFLARRQTVSDLTDEQEEAIRRDLPHQFMWHRCADGRLAFYVTIDLHHGLNLDLPVDEMVADAQWVEAPGCRAPVPSVDWSLYTLIFKVYWEGVHEYSKGGYQYADLARLIPAVEPRHAEALRGRIVRHRFEAGAHYVLRRFPSDLHLPLPPALADLVAETRDCPDGDPVAHNDLGDLWPRIWGHR